MLQGHEYQRYAVMIRSKSAPWHSSAGFQGHNRSLVHERIISSIDFFFPSYRQRFCAFVCVAKTSVPPQKRLWQTPKLRRRRCADGSAWAPAPWQVRRQRLSPASQLLAVRVPVESKKTQMALMKRMLVAMTMKRGRKKLDS